MNVGEPRRIIHIDPMEQREAAPLEEPNLTTPRSSDPALEPSSNRERKTVWAQLYIAPCWVEIMK